MPSLPKQLWASRYQARLKEIIWYQDTVISGTYFAGQGYISHRKIRDLPWLKCHLNLCRLYNHLVISFQGNQQRRNGVSLSLATAGNFERYCFENLFIICVEKVQIAFNIFFSPQRSVKCSEGCQQSVKSANRQSRGIIVSWGLTFHPNLIGWPEPREGKRLQCWASFLLMVSVGELPPFIIVILGGIPPASKTSACLCLRRKTYIGKRDLSTNFFGHLLLTDLSQLSDSSKDFQISMKANKIINHKIFITIFAYILGQMCNRNVVPGRWSGSTGFREPWYMDYIAKQQRNEQRQDEAIQYRSFQGNRISLPARAGM